MPGYSQTVREHFFHPRNAGALGNADAVGTEGTPGGGPFMEIYVKLHEERVVDISFQTFGCAASIASCSVLTEMVKGKTVQEALAVTAEDLEALLGGLPLGKEHCPGMAVSALRKALEGMS